MDEEIKDFYVWQDNLLEELFAMPVSDLESFPVMKAQLQKEHNTLYIIPAHSEKEAFELFRKSREIVEEPEEVISPKMTLH